MGTKEAAIALAKSQIGTLETPPGSNNIKYWDAIGMHSFQGQPWCAAFVSWLMRQTNTIQPVFASVQAMKNWYGSKGRLYDTPQVGDIVCYQFDADVLADHTGIVIAVNGNSITTIEGNTSSGLAGSQSDGGGVYQRVRSRGVWYGFCRPNYSVSKPSVAAPPVHPYPGHLIKLKSSDRASVRLIQTALHVAVDGAFGPITKRAVVAFQRKHGLAADGVVGPLTWRKLF